jgi:ClpX C4-type zinc finger
MPSWEFFTLSNDEWSSPTLPLPAKPPTIFGLDVAVQALRAGQIVATAVAGERDVRSVEFGIERPDNTLASNLDYRHAPQGPVLAMRMHLQVPGMCPFCGKVQGPTLRLIAGPYGVAICEECVGLYNEILAER